MKLAVSKGFTLIEALVAVVLLAIGFLGVSAMQLKALQSSHVSFQRSIATIAAQDAADRLWVELWHHSMVCPANDSDDLAQIESWHDTWSVHFNTLDVSPITGGECEYRITISWEDERFSSEDDVSTLVYFVKLPGSSA